MEKKISCIVPVKNDSANVFSFLNSYRESTYKIKKTKKYISYEERLKHFDEVIFVVTPDDLSELDKIHYHIVDFKKWCPEIRIEILKSKGISKARNAGRFLSSSDYVTFMDSDWTFKGNKLFTELYSRKNNVIYNIYNSSLGKGLTRYYNLKDAYTCFVVFNKKDCPYFNEELEFGEDRTFFEECKTKKYLDLYLKEKECPICRYNDNMSFVRYINRYIWYGSTIQKYINETKDLKTTIGLLGYIIISCFIFFIPLLVIFPMIKAIITYKNRTKGIIEVSLIDIIGLTILEVIAWESINLGYLIYILKHYSKKILESNQ